MDAAALADRPEVSGTRDDEIFVVVALVVLLALHRRACDKRHDMLSDACPTVRKRWKHCTGP